MKIEKEWLRIGIFIFPVEVRRRKGQMVVERSKTLVKFRDGTIAGWRFRYISSTCAFSQSFSVRLLSFLMSQASAVSSALVKVALISAHLGPTRASLTGILQLARSAPCAIACRMALRRMRVRYGTLQHTTIIDHEMMIFGVQLP
jgi:hypothetical protein